jgi:hypothetical protein
MRPEELLFIFFSSRGALIKQVLLSAPRTVPLMEARFRFQDFNYCKYSSGYLK